MTETPLGHDLDEDGDHDPDACYECLKAKAVTNECKCGECCKRLLIEVDVRDAEGEPRIAELGSPIYEDARLTASGKRELIGYYLNAREDMACVFLDQTTNRCSIYATRPLLCRLFDCDQEGREQLIELGILERDPGISPEA